MTPPVRISLPPQVNIKSGLPAQVGSLEIQTAMLAVFSPKNKFWFLGSPLIKHHLMYIQNQRKAENIKVKKFNFSYAMSCLKSSFKIIVPNELFSHMCYRDFWLDSMVVKEFDAKIKNMKKDAQTSASTACSSCSSSSKN